MFRVVGLVVLGLAVLQADDTAPVTFRSDVSLVRVDTQVLDRDNRAITGLSPEDFVLYEEGRRQPIRNFASENMPLDVLLLLDVSSSMRPHIERIASAAHSALRVLGDQDRVGIMVFDRYTRVRLPFRSNRSDVEREFDSLLRQESFHGGTDITRGMLDAADYVRREGRKDARHAIVIVTDDETELNRDEEGVSRALTRADAVMSALIAPDAMGTHQGRGRGGYPGGGGGGGQGGTWGSGGPTIGGPLGGIILGRRGSQGGQRGPLSGGGTHSAGTAEIARESGGDSMPVDDSYALQGTLERLRQRYALHFLLPAGAEQGQERHIQVALSESARRRYPDADLRYRRTYVATATGTYVAPTVAGNDSDSGKPAVVETAPTQKRRTVLDGSTGGSSQGPLRIPQQQFTR
ncbi:MAG TPA: VWA domain-containing protein [Bryobacteraceae bacterium]|nr:VWA domain-containing protein [Bryobacteraceae bacterium]